MRLLAIGDLHGRDVWETVNVHAYDRIVFIGDYTDSFFLDDEVIYRNLASIVKLRRRYPGRVVLLLGNHDAQYLHFPHYRCSGFRPDAQVRLTKFFARYADLFAVAHQEGRHLFTHAGVSATWHRLATERGAFAGLEHLPLAGQLNHLHQHPARRNVLFEVGPLRGGYDRASGPVWADRAETQRDPLPGYHQVVGHTPIDDIRTFGDDGGTITYIDVTETRGATFYAVTLPG